MELSSISRFNTWKMESEETKNSTFAGLGLNDWLVDQVNALGMHRPSPIQHFCVPKILDGSDCIGCAKTGSGKTAAFALPILQKLCEDPYGIFGLVITPTRELAFQIAEQFNVLGKPIGIKVIVITGGRDSVLQGIELSQKPHIVIATPGRLADHIENTQHVSFKKIRFLVLDEADRLLEDNFNEQLETIFSVLPKKRQTLLFSATFTETLRELQDVALNTPFVWHCTAPVATVDQLDQRYVLMPADVKDAYLVLIVKNFLEKKTRSAIMIFSSTCKYVQILGMVFREVGIPAVVIHSQIAQKLRLSSLARFKSHQARVLIATDVASRGLDIPTVDLVVNHNVPNVPKNYVHRVGRTARAGRGGMALTLVTQFDVKLVHAIETHINTKMADYPVVEEEVTKILTEVNVAKREAEIKLDEKDFGEAKSINKRKKLILEGKDPDADDRRKEKQARHKEKPTTSQKSHNGKIKKDTKTKHTHKKHKSKTSKSKIETA
ncbi:unnamed protein product [Owenia fusiformis]|uniref:Uncharacterized protein n=1 Tax=Owenia fusiformis TaxID=6347 RepID=A0A8J1TXH3_OWEFU|nr:unnamed protein product [Owenia fusiformis]